MKKKIDVGDKDAVEAALAVIRDSIERCAANYAAAMEEEMLKTERAEAALAEERRLRMRVPLAVRRLYDGTAPVARKRKAKEQAGEAPLLEAEIPEGKPLMCGCGAESVIVHAPFNEKSFPLCVECAHKRGIQ